MTNEERIAAGCNAACARASDFDETFISTHMATEIAKAALEAAGLNELVEALEKIGGTGWSSPEIDGRGADTLSQIFFEIQNIAQAALTGDKSNAR